VPEFFGTILTKISEGKMKKVLLIGGIALAIIALIVFSNLTSKNNIVSTYAVVKKGIFEITVSNSGELIAEKSVDILGPSIGQPDNQKGNQGRGGRQGGGGPQFGGFNMRALDLKILDIVPEGTVVKVDDYVAQLDKTSYNNTLKTELDNLETLQTNLQMKILDTAVVLTNLRDDIKNQLFVVEEAGIVLEQSKYEPPATIRKAQMNLNREQRTLEQKKKSYALQVAQALAQIRYQQITLADENKYVNDLQDYLAKFTITAPAPGMVIYKKDRNGTKRTTGSSLNAWDMAIATLPDLTSMISKIYVNEIEINKVKPGQKADIIIDAFPKKAYTGKVLTIGNIGEQLPNSDAKMFEVQIKVDGSDPALRPSMTTSNKIITKTINDVVYIPTECVQTGADSIPFVYKRNKTKQVVLLGEANDKNVIVEKGLEPGISIYVVPPKKAENFKLVGENLIPLIKNHK
jgi:HlyD family secretion protein